VMFRRLVVFVLHGVFSLLAEECRLIQIWSSQRHPQPGNDGETKKGY
jgi:hypothetical protein